jgi:hypothetical protein
MLKMRFEKDKNLILEKSKTRMQLKIWDVWKIFDKKERFVMNQKINFGWDQNPEKIRGLQTIFLIIINGLSLTRYRNVRFLHLLMKKAEVNQKPVYERIEKLNFNQK